MCIHKRKMFDGKRFVSQCDLLSVSGGVSFHSQYSIAYNILHRCLHVSKNFVKLRWRCVAFKFVTNIHAHCFYSRAV